LFALVSEQERKYKKRSPNSFVKSGDRIFGGRKSSQFFIGKIPPGSYCPQIFLDRQILIAEEATGDLDPKNTDEVISLLTDAHIRASRFLSCPTNGKL